MHSFYLIMERINLKKFLPDIVAILLFVGISVAYFIVPMTQGKILYRHDTSAGRGAGQEVSLHLQETGEVSRWTNALFSGMPTYQTSPSYESGKVVSQAVKAWHLWLPENVWLLFAYLIGFYMLLRAFDFRQYLAMLGAVIWAFSSYFLIIIAAGHLWKVFALAYLPPMIAGIVLAYRGKYLSGLIVTAIFTAFEINANHIQMTYYYLFIIFFMVIAFFIDAVRQKQLQRFWKASAVCIVAAAMGVAMNASNLYHTWQYSQETMRGKSELVKANSSNQTSSGLERDYITQWSYGIGETWTLLIPNAKCGTNGDRLGDSDAAMDASDPQLREFCAQWYQYCGDQPFTAGPVYVGAFVMMLFILSLFIVKGPMKWCLLAVTILSVLLSWGRNFQWFTDLFIDYMPMYAKFRTVSSILVIAEFTIPLLAMLGLKELCDKELNNKQFRYVWISFGLTAGACLLFYSMPTTFFDFISIPDRQNLSQYVPAEYMSDITNNIARMRVPLFTADCMRSFVIICIGMLLLLLYRMKKMKVITMVICILVLCLIDMWQIDKRYLNDSMFVAQSVRDNPPTPDATDSEILKDKSLDYRVLNLASNTFNENETSYFHKSIGGYHAAKLRRYQELIDAHLQHEMKDAMEAIAAANGDMTVVQGDSIFPVLNMLNTKYFILPLQGGGTQPLQNPYAFGNAWLVNSVKYVDNANEEISALDKIDLRHEAVADKKFESSLTPSPSLKEKGDQSTTNDPNSVTLTKYAPNKLNYTVDANTACVLVFSEIYYPGWTAAIDGKPVEIGRVNYVLRAINMPKGKHQVELSFYPKSIDVTETIAYIAIALLLAVIIIAFILQVRKRDSKDPKNQ